MIAREKFTGLSPETIMETFRCTIWLMQDRTLFSVTAINEHTELRKVANQ